MGVILIISTRVTVVHIPHLDSTLSTFLLSSPYDQEHSQVKISLKAHQRFDVFTVTVCSWVNCVQNDPQCILHISIFYFIKVMDFSPRCAIIVVAFGYVRTTSHLRISACNTHQPSISNRLYRGLKKWHHWSIRIQVYNIKHDVFLFVLKKEISIFKGHLVLLFLQIVQIKVVFHEFVRCRRDIVRVNYFHPL